MTAAADSTPSFEPPPDGPDHEVWLLRAPAHLDVSALLDGVALDADPSQSASGGTLARFESGGAEYALAVGDPGESENMRLLVPDEPGSDEEGELVAYRPFQRQVHLTSVMAGSGGASGAGEGSNIQTELALAPSKDAAPKPAFEKSGNGSVDAMRLAYVPVAQRQGLKRRWAMPGSKVTESTRSALYSSPKKKARVVPKKEELVSDEELMNEGVVGYDDTPQKTPHSSGKKAKKDKKKKEKKSKKSPKK